MSFIFHVSIMKQAMRSIWTGLFGKSA